MKEQLIKEIAKKLELEERIVEKIISHQFDSAIKATHVHNSVEISGFGKFMFNKRRAYYKLESSLAAQKNIEALLAKELSEKERRNYELKLVSVNKTVNSLKPKLYDFKIESNKGGMEK